MYKSARTMSYFPQLKAAEKQETPGPKSESRWKEGSEADMKLKYLIDQRKLDPILATGKQLCESSDPEFRIFKQYTSAQINHQLSKYKRVEAFRRSMRILFTISVLIICLTSLYHINFR